MSGMEAAKDQRKAIAGGTGCCVARGEGTAEAPVEGLNSRQRLARALAGLGFLALGVGLAWGGLALEQLAAGALAVLLCAVPCALGVVAGWFGLSHLVAAATAYRGCPELGAIASLFTREPVETACAPWERIDRRLERRQSR